MEKQFSSSKKIKRTGSKKKRPESVIMHLDSELDNLKKKCLSNHKSFAEKL